MKTISTQQEVLLFTNSSFAHKQWCKKNNDNHRDLSPEENLEEACANGLIQELLPEVFNMHENKMYLWQMNPAFYFVQLELGELPLAIEKELSIDPHNFLFSVHCN